MDISEAAELYQFDLNEVAQTYFALSERLELSWLRQQINALPVDNQWDALAKEACRDDLDWQQRSLTIAVLQDVKKADIGERIEHWLEQHKEMYSRWQNMLANLRGSSTVSFIVFQWPCEN